MNKLTNEKKKYRQIYEFLKRDVVNGCYKYKQQLPTDNELAETFGVSRPTVARALVELQRKKMVERRIGAGTYVTFRQAAKQTRTFGLLIPGLGETEIFEPICGQIAHMAEENDFDLLWGASMGKDEQQRRIQAEQLCARYVKRMVDGVFFVPLAQISEGDSINQRIAGVFDKARIPIVVLDRDIALFPACGKYDVVGIDNFRASYILAQHLLDCGCKRIVFAARTLFSPTVGLRIDGYRKALNEAGVIPDSNWIHFVEPDNADFVRNLVVGSRSTGLMCANDDIAAIVMKHLNELDVRVPDEIQLVGFDDVRYARNLHIPLTTYRQPCREIGTVAVKTMLTRIADPNMPQRTIYLDGELVVRKSTKASGTKI